MKKLVSIVLVRVSLALLFAVLDVALKWEYFRWDSYAKVRYMNTLLHPVLILFICLLLGSALVHAVRELYKSRKVPFVQEVVEKAILWLRAAFSKLGVQFVFWGLVIASVIGYSWNTGLLRDEDFKYNQIPIPWEPFEVRTDSPVKILNFYTRDNNQTEYLQSCVKITQDLKAVGAKVVVVPLPFIFSERLIKLVEKIHEAGIVVFGLTSPDFYLIRQSQQRVGLRTGRMWRFDYYKQPLPGYHYIQKVEPFPYNHYSADYDVSFEVLRTYFGISPEEKIIRGENEVSLGKHTFPIDKSGSLYVGRQIWGQFRSTINAVYDMKDLSKESSGEKKVEYVLPKALRQSVYTSTLVDFRDQFEGKIIVLSPQDFATPFADREANRYAQIVDHMIRGEVLTRSRLGSLLFALVCIVGCGLILYRTKPLAAIALLMLFSAFVFYGNGWLFQVKGILVDVPASFAALLLSMAVFTVMRLGYEWRFGVGRGVVVPPAPVFGGGAVDATKSPTGFAFLWKRMSFSPAAALGVLILVIVTTALVTRGIDRPKPADSPKEIVYVTSLPTVEVQGVYIPNKEVK